MSFLDDLEIPIIQAPMLGASTPQMALAVSQAGGLGSLAAASMTGADLEAEIARLRAATDRPFAVNLLMAQQMQPSAGEIEQAMARLRPFYEARGIPMPGAPNDYALDFNLQFEALVRAAPPAASFTFSILTPAQVAALKARDVYVIGTATTVAEAKAWEAVGADAVCVQGSEAGGHRGTFLAPVEDSLVGTMALTAASMRAVSIPVIAAGGIMDGRGVAAALALGAAAAQMGTAFLLTDQTMVSAPWAAALRSATGDNTRLTRAFSGRFARGVENDFMRAMRPVENDVPAYPVQNRLTQPLRAAATKQGDASAISLWAGQAVELAGPGDAGALVRQWWDEAKVAARAVAARTSGG